MCMYWWYSVLTRFGYLTLLVCCSMPPCFCENKRKHVGNNDERMYGQSTLLLITPQSPTPTAHAKPYSNNRPRINASTKGGQAIRNDQAAMNKKHQRLKHPSEGEDSCAEENEETSRPAEGYDFEASAEHHNQHDLNATAIKPHYGPCLIKYGFNTCREVPERVCSTKRLCVQITGTPCCAPPRGECPSPLQLDMRCVKSRPVNWCSKPADCTRGAMCCDTGCGYNVCVERHAHA